MFSMVEPILLLVTFGPIYFSNSTSAKSSIGFSCPAPDASAPLPGSPAYLYAAIVQGPHNVCASPCTLSNWFDCAISQTHPAGDRISAIEPPKRKRATPRQLTPECPL